MQQPKHIPILPRVHASHIGTDSVKTVTSVTCASLVSFIGPKRWSCCAAYLIWVVVSNMFFIFSPVFGKWSILTNIFSTGLKPPTSHIFLITFIYSTLNLAPWQRPYLSSMVSPHLLRDLRLLHAVLVHNPTARASFEAILGQLVRLDMSWWESYT